MVCGRADGGRRRTLLPLGHGPQGKEWRSSEHGPFEFIAMTGEKDRTQKRCVYTITFGDREGNCMVRPEWVSFQGYIWHKTS